jgi:hypothetical protein
MSWFTWTIYDQATSDFCTSAFLVLPIFGLAYLVQNSRDLGLRLDDEPADGPAGLTRKERARELLRDQGDLRALTQGMLFYIGFVTAFGFAVAGILSTPRSWLLGSVFLSFALTGYGLFSRIGTRMTYSLFHAYERQGGRQAYENYLYSKWLVLTSLYLPLFRELFQFKHIEDEQLRGERRRRKKVIIYIFALGTLTTAFFLFVVVTGIRLIFFSHIIPNPKG